MVNDGSPARAADDANPVLPVAITPAAAQRLRDAMTEQDLSDASVRIFVSGGGCAGLRYGMGFETEHGADDHAFVSSDLTVVVDPVSLMYLQGATVDFVDDPTGGGFKIDNPNAVACGGCGGSTSEEGAPGADGACRGSCCG